ncbi:DUF3313 domain-containing protein [Pokkaliibacter plantistimulans]|uniref:DUF3313 domain-containing protein n=1 Tax=Proteobacteria bacterium 228 TaxID=2083153 RepID=A0A2S5KVI0_9PROT|nr:DUF3313 domain-containing protein [Pokkaliibacter plantistimulans]PPC78854.1 DUF3313 domain-containing protein [Pokkaliibacter plantistimulans]
MNQVNRIYLLLSAAFLIAIFLSLSGCTTPDPIRYQQLSSSSYLQGNHDDSDRHIAFDYAQAIDWQKYHQLILEPVSIYRAPDNQFVDLDESDKVALAHYMQQQFGDRLRSRFQLVDHDGPATLRLKLTLTGAEKTTPVISTVSRFDIGGGIYNGVAAMRGREGLFTGSVIYAVEIYDASSNQLLNAAVIKQYPSPMQLSATIGALDASKAGIDKGAEALLAYLR